MSSFFLNEKLTFFGWVGCFLCIVCLPTAALWSHSNPCLGRLRNHCPQWPRRAIGGKHSRVSKLFRLDRVPYLRWSCNRYSHCYRILHRSQVRRLLHIRHVHLLIMRRYGKTSMLWYIAVCSLIGGLSVSCTQALGAAIVTSIRGENQVRVLSAGY